MVRVKAPLMSMSAQKQLGHSLIYKQKGSRSFVTGYNKPGGKNPSPASAKQKNKRMIYNLIIARWQTLTDEQKAVYNDLVKAKNLNMSGWNYFYKMALTDLPTYLGLQCYLSFNEIVGGKILDLSGNGNDGTLEPAYPTNAPQLVDSFGKKFGQAGSFDGVDDYLNVPDSATTRITGQITIEFWIYNKIVITGSPSTLYKYYPPKGWYMIMRGASTGNAQPEFFILGVGGLKSASVLKLNSWSHIVFTYDGTSMNCYINGVLDKTSALSGAITYGVGDMTIAKASHADVQYYGTMFDEIRLWNRALSASEVLKHYELISKK